MTKAELITFLRDPSKLSSNDLDELENIIQEHPYFLSGRLLLAKGSKELKDPKAKPRIASAAIYSTDRILLKKYLSGNLFFLREPVPSEEDNETKEPVAKREVLKEEPKKEDKVTKVAEDPSEQVKASESPSKSSTERTDKRPSALKPVKRKPSPEVPDVPSGELDTLLDELQKNMKDLQESRQHFAEVQEKIEEEDAVSAALEKATPTIEEREESHVEDKQEEAVLEDKPEEAVEPSKEAAESLGESKEEPEATTSESQDEDEIIAKKLAEISGSLLKTKEEDAESGAKDEEEDASSRRAERTINEPRFSRFSTRSYLRDLSIDNSEEEDKNEETSELKKAPTRKPRTTRATRSKKAEETQEDKEVEKTEAKSDAVAEEESKKKTPVRKTAAKAKKTTTAKKTTSKTTTTKKTPAAKKATAKTTKTTTTKKATTAKKTPAKKSSASKSTSASKSKSTKKTEESKDDGKGEREKKNQLIDKFIKDSPTIKYKRGEEQATQDLAEPSGSWDPNLASEYLAEIYLHQGNKARAIEIYKALSLKYPEKKSYFADLISKIE